MLFNKQQVRRYSIFKKKLYEPNLCLLCKGVGGGDEQIIMRNNVIKRSDYIPSVANHIEKRPLNTQS